MSGMSCFWNNNLNGKSTGKGKRLIVSHAVTPDGPVCERDPVTNVWHDNLMWKGNMPHPKEFEKREANLQAVGQSAKENPETENPDARWSSDTLNMIECMRISKAHFSFVT
jgi:hypothetical protein